MVDYVKHAERFYYDETSPSCIRAKYPWVVGYGGIRRPAGAPTGYLHSQGYYFVKVGNESLAVHRLVWVLHYGDIDTAKDVDHINRNRSDNRIENLRLVDAAGNCRNISKNPHNKSGVTGVSYAELYDKKGGIYSYWKAAWKDLDGKQRGKSFSIDKLGDEGAFEAACKCRADAVEELNRRGAGYTETHGE